METTVRDEQEGGGTEASAPAVTADTAERRPRPPTPRSPLVIAAIAYGLLLWMLLVVFTLVAWRLGGG